MEVMVGAVQTETLGRRFKDAMPPWPVSALAALAGFLIPALLLQFPMELIIGAVVGIVGLTVVIAYPFLGLLIFLGLLYLRPEESFPALAGARMALNVSLAAFFAWVVNACLCRERFRFHLPVVGCFLGFLFVAVGSTAINGANNLSETAMELLKLLILFVLIVHLANSDARLRVMAGALVLFTAILGAKTIWQYQNGEAMVTSEGEVRALATGIFGDPNDLALAMAMALPLALGTIFGKVRGWTRFWNLLAVPILIWCIFVTNSRGGVLALAAGVLVFFGRRLGKAGFIVGLIAVLGLFAFGPSRVTKMSSDEESAQGRVTAWEAGMDMLSSSPIWGVGKAQFVEHHPRTAHNSLVLCLAELGMAGTALWLGLFYFAFRDTKKASAYQAQQALAAEPEGATPKRVGVPCQSMVIQVSLIAFAVGGFFLSRTYTAPLYVYLGLAVAAAQVEWGPPGEEMPGATGRDWLNIGLLTLAGLLLVQFLIRLWGS